MHTLLYSPQVILAAFFVVFMVSIRLFTKLAPKGELGEHALDPYACGQRDFENYIHPNYSQFYRYAFVFTEMHMLTMVLATAPKDATVLPLVYVAAGVLALLIIFREVTAWD